MDVLRQYRYRVRESACHAADRDGQKFGAKSSLDCLESGVRDFMLVGTRPVLGVMSRYRPEKYPTTYL